MKCPNIYSKTTTRVSGEKNIDMCQYVVNGNDYHLNIKRVGKRERESFRFKSFLYQWEMPPGFCLQAQSNKDPVVLIYFPKKYFKKNCSVSLIHLSDVLLFRLTL